MINPFSIKVVKSPTQRRRLVCQVKSPNRASPTYYPVRAPRGSTSPLPTGQPKGGHQPAFSDWRKPARLQHRNPPRRLRHAMIPPPKQHAIQLTVVKMLLALPTARRKVLVPRLARQLRSAMYQVPLQHSSVTSSSRQAERRIELERRARGSSAKSPGTAAPTNANPTMTTTTCVLSSICLSFNRREGPGYLNSLKAAEIRRNSGCLLCLIVA